MTVFEGLCFQERKLSEYFGISNTTASHLWPVSTRNDTGLLKYVKEKTEMNHDSNQFDTTHSLDEASNSSNCCLATVARQRLHSSRYALLKLVECEQKNGVIVIRGTVSSYFLKQIAQEQLRSIQGMTHIVNELVVQKEL